MNMVDYLSFFESTSINYMINTTQFHMNSLEDYHEAGMNEYGVIQFNVDNNIGSSY